MAEKLQRSATIQKSVPKSVPKDVDKIVRYLSNTFNMVTKELDKAIWTTVKGANEAYTMQTEFAYLINEIMLCAPCVIQKNISACNEFIDSVAAKLNK